ncbi:MAG TPA: high-affinity nickel-transporter [Desulfonatronum sp.]|nr:high-affinity nickel-transporter [Desulfonatronum sp.]
MKTFTTVLAAVLFCLLFLGPAWSQNPFLTPPGQGQKPDQADHSNLDRNQGEPRARPRPTPTTGPKITPPFFAKIAALQRDLRQKITAYAREIQEKPWGRATWQLMALSLVYGIVHALGPGHGKSIVCSYFLSRRGTMKQALLFGNLITATHILSAVIVVLGLSWFMGRANIAAFHSVEGRLESVSYLLIMLVGVFLLGKTILEWRTTPQEHTEDCSRASTRDMLTLSLATGLMPCPGAALILLFTLSLDVFWAGLLAMVPLALGMGLTASALGVFTVGSTGLALNLSRRSKRTFILAHRIMACLGALVIIVLGASLFFGMRFS